VLACRTASSGEAWLNSVTNHKRGSAQGVEKESLAQNRVWPRFGPFAARRSVPHLRSCAAAAASRIKRLQWPVMQEGKSGDPLSMSAS
jgi:hypothetical protein